MHLKSILGSLLLLVSKYKNISQGAIKMENNNNLQNVIMDEHKFLNMIANFGFKAEVTGENIALIKSKHDNWQVEVEWRENIQQYHIRLNHMNKTNKFTIEQSERYHRQGYYKTYRSVLNYIKKHDEYVAKRPDRHLSREMKELNKMEKLFDLINNGTKKPQLQTH